MHRDASGCMVASLSKTNYDARDISRGKYPTIVPLSLHVLIVKTSEGFPNL